MLFNKKKIIGAVIAGTLALGVLGGTTAFAASGGSPSLVAVPGVDISAIAATAQPGTVTVVGKVDIAALENASTAAGPTLTAVSGVDLDDVLAHAVIMPADSLTVVKELRPPIAGAVTVTTAPAPAK